MLAPMSAQQRRASVSLARWPRQSHTVSANAYVRIDKTPELGNCEAQSRPADQLKSCKLAKHLIARRARSLVHLDRALVRRS